MSLNMNKSLMDIQDEFKKAFKYYKSKKDKPDFSKVLNYHVKDDVLKSSHQRINTKNLSSELNKWRENLFIKPIEEWEAYYVYNHPGLIIVQNGLTEWGSMLWIQKCLEQFSESPFKTNLLSNGRENADESWWSQVKYYLVRSDKNELINQLRWSTLGYHHNWDTKEYSENEKSAMPEELKMFCKIFLASLDLPEALAFNAEAAIVNYYPPGSTLSPHTDHSEPDKEAPLLSLSFGRSAIFLIGGTDKSVTPTPIFLHHGDLLIMSGSSRQCYHSVPRILNDEEMLMNGGSGSLSSFISYWMVIIESLNKWFEGSTSNSNIIGWLNTVESVNVVDLDNFGFMKELIVKFITNKDLSESSLNYSSAVLNLNSKDILAFVNYTKGMRMNMNIRQVNTKLTNK